MIKIVTTQTSSENITPFLSSLKVKGIPCQIHNVAKGYPELEEGDLLILMGERCVAPFRKEGIFHKSKTLNKLRQEITPLGKGFVLVTYDVGICSQDTGKRYDIIWDFQLAVRWVQQGNLLPVLGKYQWVTSYSHIVDYIKTASGKVTLALDLETIGTDPYRVDHEELPDAKIVSVSITHKDGMADAVYLKDLTPAEYKQLVLDLKYICTTDKVKMLGANLKFDSGWLKVHMGFFIENLTMDTMLIGSLLDENRSNSLELHAKIYTDMGGYDAPMNNKYDKGRMDLIPKNDLLPYAGSDTLATYKVAEKMKKDLLKVPSLSNFYVRISKPASKVFAKLEHRGVVVDLKRYEEVRVEVQEALDHHHQKAIDLMPYKLQCKHKGNLKLSRAAVLKDFMFSPLGLNLKPKMLTEKTQQPSTAFDHLIQFEDNPDAKEFVTQLKAYNSASKTMSTYIVGFLKHLRSDGKFHPTYLLHRGDSNHGSGTDVGTTTGRLSATAPSYQTLPKHTIWAPKLRSVYVPPAGMAILKLDYSQGELRVAACVANETNLIHAYKTGLDAHLVTGAEVYGLSLQEVLIMKENNDPMAGTIRQGGKAGNFGLIYGMQPEGFQQYAKATYGVELSLQHCIDFRARFFKLYPKLLPWHQTYINLAKNNLEVVSPLGRVRHLPLIHSRHWGTKAQQERRAINAPIQSTLSDAMQLAMIEIDKAYPDLWMFGTTHDEVQCYVPEDDVLLWKDRLKGILENLPFHLFGWAPQLTLVADAESSNINLAECKSM